MSLWRWSKTSSDNATADPTINWAEGQAPSSINDSARAMMSALAMYRDDISGAIVTAGSSTAYTVSSNSGYDELAHLDGQVIAFTPHTTNGATVTLSVDGLTAKPLRSGPSTELLAGTIIQGTPYVAVYNNTDGAFYLQSFYGNPYNIPLGAGLDYWGPTTPNSSFAFPAGQAVSRTGATAPLFALFGTTYGAGDGSTTFNLPDRRGRVSAQLDASAGRLSSFTSLGTVGGEQAHTLSTGELPANIPASATTTLSGSQVPPIVGTGFNSISSTGGGNTFPTGEQSISAATTVSVGGSGQSHNNVQPTIACNYILRII